MATIRWKGDAPNIAQVVTVTLGGTVAAGDDIVFTINGKSLRVEAASTSLTALATLIASEWDDCEIAEFLEVTATASENVVTLTAATAGKPFTVTVNANFGQLSIVETTPGTDGEDEVQQFYFTPTPTGGTYTITFDGQTTTPINYNATAAQVLTALLALSNLDADDVTVSGSGTSSDPFVLEFGEDYLATDVAEITVNAAGLAGGNAITITTIRNGSAGGTNAVYVVGPDTTASTFILGFRASVEDEFEYTAALNWNDSVATVTAALEALNSIASGDVTVTGGRGQTSSTFLFVIQFAGRYAGAALGNQHLTTTTSGVTIAVFDAGGGSSAVAYELEVLNLGSATAGTFTLTDGVDTTGAIAFNASAATIYSTVQAALTTDPYQFGAAWAEKSGVHLFVRDGVANVAALTINTGGLTGTGTVQTARNGGVAALNEMQRVYTDATGGTFTLTFGGQTTAAIVYNANAVAVDAALTALSTIDSVTVTGSGTAADPWFVEFTGSHAGTDVAELTGSAANLTGGITAEIDTTTAGSGAVNEVQTITVTASGGTFTLEYDGAETSAIAYNASAATVDAALEALSTIGAGDVAVTGSAGGPYTVTFGGALAGTNVPLIVGDNTNLTGTGSLTATSATEVSSSGQWHADDVLNYTGGALPANGDTLIFTDSEADCLYGLNALAAVTLAELIVNQSFIGTIGLPDYDAEGEYYQYRGKYLEVSATLVSIGAGDGAGSGRVKLDLKAVASTITIQNTGQPAEQGRKAVQLKGTHASNVLNVVRGSVDVAPDQGDVSTIVTARVSFAENVNSDSDVRFGDAVTLTNVLVQGGKVEIASATTTLKVYEGEVTLIGTGAQAAVSLWGGKLINCCSGTVTALLISNAEADYSRDPRPKVVTDTIQGYRGGILRDPLGVLIAGGLDYKDNVGGFLYIGPPNVTSTVA